MKNKKEEVQKKLEEVRAEKVRKSIAKMNNRFEAAIGRLENISIRISTRLDTLEKSGKDVSKSKTDLESAVAKVSSARAKLSEAKASLEAIADSETPKTVLEEAKVKTEEVKTLVMEAHVALVDVINSIKGASESK